jgi:hypothetical protein
MGNSSITSTKINPGEATDGSNHEIRSITTKKFSISDQLLNNFSAFDPSWKHVGASVGHHLMLRREYKPRRTKEKLYRWKEVVVVGTKHPDKVKVHFKGKSTKVCPLSQSLSLSPCPLLSLSLSLSLSRSLTLSLPLSLSIYLSIYLSLNNNDNNYITHL